MIVETENRDEIFAEAIGIASAVEREAFIAGACDGNAPLRRQVEEQVAAHLHAASAAPKSTAVASSYVTPAPDQTGAAKPGMAPTPAPAPAHWLATATVILLATTVASSAAAVWAMRSQGDLQRQLHEAVNEREEAVNAKKEFANTSGQAEAARAEVSRERAQILASAKANQSALDDARAVLAFFQQRVMSAARPGGLAGGEGKKVTLRKALDLAEPDIAKSFAKRPSVEAAIRETIGATYLDLEEPKLAVNQFERALALWQAVLGPNHANTVSCRNKLAVAYRAAGRTVDAGQLFNRSDESAVKYQPAETRKTP